MSSPNHSTSNIEDAFSLNFLDYLSTSPDYVPASPGKSYSSSSNSFGLVPLASPTLSLLHDDPYMKVLQAFYTEKSPIPPSIITPPSLMLNPQEFFLSEKMPPKRTSTSEAPAMTQAAIRNLVVDSVTTALETQATTMANADNANRNPKPREALVARNNYTEDCNVKFAHGTLTEEALSWWNSFAQPIGMEEAYKITSVEFKKLLIKKYCPRTKIQKMEDEFYHLTMKGNDLKTYVRIFQELETLCPTMVSDSEKMMEAFIGGLPRGIEGNVTATKPQTLEEAINIAQRLMDQALTGVDQSLTCHVACHIMAAGQSRLPRGILIMGMRNYSFVQIWQLSYEERINNAFGTTNDKDTPLNCTTTRFGDLK
nr:reverse transcriptase domain-containing protein [Tanacetum cinerariifolium]